MQYIVYTAYNFLPNVYCIQIFTWHKCQHVVKYLCHFSYEFQNVLISCFTRCWYLCQVRTRVFGQKWWFIVKKKKFKMLVFFSHTCCFASEVIDSGPVVVWGPVMFALFGFWRVNFRGPVDFNYMDSQR